MILGRARAKGDRRPAAVILHETTSKQAIVKRAFDEAHRDPERAETVVKKGNNYPEIGIYEAEVLTRARSYVHPRLAIL